MMDMLEILETVKTVVYCYFLTEDAKSQDVFSWYVCRLAGEN